MKYLPIFQELFQSDTVFFLLIGAAVSFFIGLRKMKTKTRIILSFISFAVYVLSEVILNLHTNYMLEFIVLFLGTIAIGALIGFAAAAVICKLRKKIRIWQFDTHKTEE